MGRHRRTLNRGQLVSEVFFKRWAKDWRRISLLGAFVVVLGWVPSRGSTLVLGSE